MCKRTAPYVEPSPHGPKERVTWRTLLVWKFTSVASRQCGLKCDVSNVQTDGALRGTLSPRPQGEGDLADAVGLEVHFGCIAPMRAQVRRVQCANGRRPTWNPLPTAPRRG